MPSERRNLRSNTSSDPSANGDKPRSTSQSSGSNNKDKPVTRSASSRTKAAANKKGENQDQQQQQQQQQQAQTNGSEKNVENGVNGAAEDVEMTEDKDEEMTVVVPPSKKTNNKLSGEKEGERDDVAMEDEEQQKEPEVDPKEKAFTDIKNNFTLLERAVAHFDARYILRVLRTVSSVRQYLSSELLSRVITETYPSSDPTASFLLRALGKESGMEVDNESKPSTSKNAVLPEVDIYLAILIQTYLYDQKAFQQGADFSNRLVEQLRGLNRRTLDSLSERVYFYYSLFYEQLAPHPPSPAAAVISIRQTLLSALRTAVLRKDQDIQATVTNLLLRNYLSTSHISQADLFISHSEFPPAASNNQIARYLYYLGRIRAIQLQYTEAHQHLTGATRKSPTNHSANGFYQASTKLLVIVELLMGDIPDRAIFRQPTLERAMHPYFLLVQAVSIGDLDGFLNIVQKHSETFRRDGTYTLIIRLRQNVIKTGIRMMSLSYTRISLRDICLRLGLDSEESAEYIVAKAIRDGVIEATLDHERGFMKSKDVGDVYATQEPGEVFHERIRACLALHDESVKAMRFPMNQHRLELKNAQEARERERELAKEIQEGDMDEDDAGGDFEGI